MSDALVPINGQHTLYPCEPWPIDPVCCPDWPANEEDWQPEHFEAQRLATIILWRAVAGAIGLCRIVEAPCMDQCVSGPPYGEWMIPYVSGGEWFNASACGCFGSCQCTRMCTVTLTGPVHEIVQVRVHGEILDPSSYALLPNDVLARRGGCWPVCQEYREEDGGLRVEFLRGTAPGLDAIRAVSLLACRKLAECPPAGGGGCGELPSRVTSVNREGLSMQLGEAGPNPDNPLVVTGIARVDNWIASINPYGVTSQATVWTPDIDPPMVWRGGFQ